MSEPAPETTAPAGPKPYVLVGQPIQVNRFSDQLQRVVEGYEVSAQWLNGGTIVTVFVPSSGDVAAEADIAIRAAGAKLDALMGLTG